jgi:hypothetical protein
MESVTTARELALATRADDNDSGVARYLDGRLGDDRLSRREVARWRLVRLDGVWYDRARLAAQMRLAASRRVPHSRRLLTPAESADLESALADRVPAAYRYS